MTVVKFSILTLIAGGFCTLLGIGMWMGPQETPCSAQTGTTTVAVAESPAPCKSCWSQPSDVTFSVDVVATESQRCGGGPCSLPPSDACESGACDLVASSAPAEPTAYATSAPAHAVVPRIPPASFGACDSGVCVPPGASYAVGGFCPPGVPCPQPQGYAAPVYHVAPCAGPDCPPPAYSSSYAVVPAHHYPAPVYSAYASSREVEPCSNDEPSMEMIEAFMEEREKRYESQIESLEAMMELKLEAQEALLKAEHQVEMAKLHAEAYVKLAGMEQALREEKALLQLVADGTLPTESLRAILARNHANGHGSPVQQVSTAAADSACEKCACETCKCEQTVSIAAPASTACQTSACEAKACTTTACTKSACDKSGECKSCEATTVVSVEACDKCTKECEACVKAPKSLERIGVEFDFEGERCTILSDGLPMAILGDGCRMTAQDLVVIGATQGREGDCTIVFGQKGAECATGECKTVEFRMGKKSVAVETTNAPFVCEKDGCEVRFDVTGDMPDLSNIPYLGRLFQNPVASEAAEEAAPAEEAKR